MYNNRGRGEGGLVSISAQSQEKHQNKDEGFVKTKQKSRKLPRDLRDKMFTFTPPCTDGLRNVCNAGVWRPRGSDWRTRRRSTHDAVRGRDQLHVMWNEESMCVVLGDVIVYKLDFFFPNMTWSHVSVGSVGDETGRKQLLEIVSVVALVWDDQWDSTSTELCAHQFKLGGDENDRLD